MRQWLPGLLVMAGLVAAWLGYTRPWGSDGAMAPQTVSGGEILQVEIPELSTRAQIGQEVFGRNCAQCHGANGGGTDQGPPLIHIIYEPNHHSDPAFHLAVQRGVRAHHWGFGDMPPVEGVSVEETDAIIAFVREVQRANGIR